MHVLLIRKLEGDFENVLVRDAETKVAAHIQIPVGEGLRRVVVAMPAGKAALCFETAQSAGWAVEDDIVTFAEEAGQNGVLFSLVTKREEISIPVSSILMHHTLMARFGVDSESKNESKLRDLIASGGIKDIESWLGMSLSDLSDRGQTIGPIIDAQQGRITFTRRALDGKHHYQMEFVGGDALKIRESGDSIHISRKTPSANEPLRLTIRVSTDFELLTPMSFDDLVNDRGRNLFREDEHFAEAVRNFEFLSFMEKYLAGSWNFLSYFGRDTLIALRVMWHVLSHRAKQTGIQSVVNEMSEDGIVNVTDEWMYDRTVADAIERFFREYDRRNIDGARRIMESILDGSVPERPFLDVLDQTFMFPSAASHWFEELDDSTFVGWLKEDHSVLGRTESNLVTLLRNWNYILRAASPYVEAWKNLRAKYPALGPRQIIEARRDEFRKTSRTLVHSIAGAANWRDTYNLPWHFRAEDINVNLLPMAIAAMQETIERISATVCRQDLIDLSKKHSLDVVSEYLEEPGTFRAARESWDRDLIREHYLVRRSANDMRQDLERYLEGLFNGDVFGRDRERGVRERDTLLRCEEGGVTVSEFLHENRMPDTVKDGVEFTALFLDSDGRPLPLMHSDDVYLLLFGNPTIDQVREIVQPFVLSYPFGLGFLQDDIGMAVTNAVYAPRDDDAFKDNTKNVWVKFGPDEYHGRGAWPWVMFALISGIYDQVMKGIDEEGNLRNGATPDDIALFREILKGLKSSIEKLGPLATSEMFKFSPANKGEGGWRAKAMGISTPIQLWSAAPANMLIHEALERTDLADPAIGA
ncbi:MAG: hypothetical protein KJ626_02635 [Verrucomicrobia bacterium]|nr:hypothetical protein [Verrucomicrobiota bacterium]